MYQGRREVFARFVLIACANSPAGLGRPKINLKKINRIFFFCAGAVALTAAGFFVHRALAGADDNVHGWAWSENIGWVSMNSENDSGGSGSASEPGLVQRDARRSWGQTAMSADGKYQIALGRWEYEDGKYRWTFYTSSDYGKTWIRGVDDAGPLIFNGDAAISDDGQFQIVVGGTTSGGAPFGEMYISTDGGETWSKNQSGVSWSSVSMSGDGNYLILTTSDMGFYVSFDRGLSWADCYPVQKMYGAALSSDGKYQIVVNEHFSDYVLSSDYSNGNKFDNCGFGSPFSFSPNDYMGNRSVAMSADGKYVTVAMNSFSESHDDDIHYTDYLYVSSDNGASFKPKGPRMYWDSVAIEGDGKHQIAGASLNDSYEIEIYDSFDYGNTWTKRPEGVISGREVDVAVSADGSCELYAVEGGYLYTVGCDGGGSEPGGAGVEYGVDIDESTGVMSGYAWSENIGWVSFNAADAAGCGGCSGGDCQAKVSLTSNTSGQHEISGWAKVLANGGGWDGCVSLRGSNYGVSIDPATGDFHGWAWSDMVLGWLSFNSVDSGAAGGPYKVYTSAGFSPTAKMECGGAGANCAYGACDNNAGGTWTAYSPTQECPICIYPVKDISEGNVACAYWTLSGPANYEYQASGPGQTINLSAFANRIVPGNYTLSLRVSNETSAGCVSGNTDTATHDIVIKQGIDANFVCALGDPIYDEETNPEPAPWQDCTSSAGKADFAKRIVDGGKIYAKDISLYSEEGTDIVNWNWRITVDGAESTDNEEMVDFTAGKNNKIELKVFDNGGRTNCKSVDFTARSLPKWEEVPI